jgi:hypothetical protein
MISTLCSMKGGRLRNHQQTRGSEIKSGPGHPTLSDPTQNCCENVFRMRLFKV